MVSIIIVNWNAGAALSACLASLAADAAEGGSARQVILVDNGSSDGSTAVARDRYREVEVLQTGSNLGFAAGANHGAEAARGDVVVFLNPDACVRTGAIRTLVDALLLTPGAGIAGGGLVDAHGRWEPAAARFGPLRHLLLDTTVGRLPARRRRAPYRARAPPLPARGKLQVRPQDRAGGRVRPPHDRHDLRASPARLPRFRSVLRDRMTDAAGLVTLAVPCRADEPALGRALALAWRSWRRVAGPTGRPLEIAVCLNGPN